jgi:4'-phosphopantetheinyl transferase
MHETSSRLGVLFSASELPTPHRDVTVHLVDVAPGKPHQAEILATLSADERARAARFHSLEDRLRFGLTRAALRLLLARGTGSAPAAVAFTTAAGGKPALSGNGPHFNVSHSGSYALVGISRQRPIGVDIEKARELDDLLAIAEACFSPGEYRRLAALPPGERTRSFFAIWTGKEAVSKALGSGIDASLRDFSVRATRSAYAIAPETGASALRLAGIVLERLEVPEDYAAALALA